MNDDIYADFKKTVGYEGCRNCVHQIEPLRACKWLEQGGDGAVHLVCPRWEKRQERSGK